MSLASSISLFLYFAVMLGIGVYSFRRSSAGSAAFMLGGRGLGPAVTALSAGASDMSGWMLMGLPGAMYLSGLSSAWIAIGLLIGALLNYLVVAPRLRTYTELANNAITLPEYFSNRFDDQSKILRVLSSVVIILFFTLYTSSGLVAGGKLFETSFALDYQWGLYITASVVVIYTLLGGFLAVSRTDFVQGCVMLLALVMVPVAVLWDIGGISQFQVAINKIDPTLLDMLENVSALGVISAMAWGLGYFGQPHILVRFMAIKSIRDLPTATSIGMGWMLITLLGAVCTGLLGIVYIAQHGIVLNDAETIFISLSQVLFHPLVAGFMLAAILAAIMSTISSQLLVTSSSLTEDFYCIFFHQSATDQQRVLIARIAVLLVAVVALWLAQDRSSSILSLVSNAWAGFGAAFGPVIIFSLYWQRMTRNGALAGMLVGTITVLIWVYAPITIDGSSLSEVIYEIVPGFILATVAIIVVSKFDHGNHKAVEDLFSSVQLIHKPK